MGDPTSFTALGGITDMEPPELQPGTQPHLQREGNTDLSVPRWVTPPCSFTAVGGITEVKQPEL